MNAIVPHVTQCDRRPVEPVGVCRIEIRSNYGRLAAYPVNETARLFADMVGSKTLTHGALCYIERLGYLIISSADADWHKVG